MPDQQTDDTAKERAGLGDLARTGLTWSLLNSAASRFLNVAAGLIIARIVSPGELGSYAAAVLVMTIVLSMNEAGLSVAIIRWKGAVDRTAPTAVTGSLLSSGLWFALMFFGAPSIAALLNAPEADIAIRILSFGVLIDGISTIPNALLMRSFRQRTRAAAELVGFCSGTPVGIALAGAHGAGGLAIGLLIANAVTAVLILVLARTPLRFGWDRQIAVDLLRTGFYPALTSLLLLAIINVDSVVVSRVLGASALGFYTLAFNVANWPLTLLSMSIRQVSLPAFSQLSDDRRQLEDAFSQSLSLAAGIAVLSGILLVTLAEPLVAILYGEKWLPAVMALQWLALFGALRVILELCYDLLVAVGRAGVLLRLQLGWIATLAVTLPIGAHLHGIAGVALAQAIVVLALVLPLNMLLVVRSGLRPGALTKPLGPIASASAAAIAMALVAEQLHPSNAAMLCVGGPAIAAAYGAAFLANRAGREALGWANLPVLSRWLVPRPRAT